MAHTQQVLFFAIFAFDVATASHAVSFRVQKHNTLSQMKQLQLAQDIECPAPIFISECSDDGTCFCVCKDKEQCPSTALVLSPEEAAKLANEAFQWVDNGAPYSLVQVSGQDIKCPAPIFVAECKGDTCFCVCKDKETCPSTALILDPAEAAKLAKEAIEWVKNGAPYSLTQVGGNGVKCPAPIFAAECKKDGTCFCVCKDKEKCPSTALVLKPAEAAKLAKETFQWVDNGAPYSFAQVGSNEIKCPAPIFVAECKGDTCFCVCKDKETCPSTAIILDPVEAAKLAKEAIEWVKNGAPYSLAQASVQDIKCPAPIFVAECKGDTCFCVCKDKETCPSTALILDPAEAAKLSKEYIQWVKNGAPYSLAQVDGRDIQCPAPIFVAECGDDGTCFCVCKDKEQCPSTALVLSPEEAATLANEAFQWVDNGAPYSLVQVSGQDIKCPAPIFVAECKGDTCFCVCKDKETCPSTAIILDPVEAAKLAKEAIEWVKNGAPYSLAQIGDKEIKCPAPIFAAECKDDGTCFCVCKDKENCPSTALVLDPAEAAKLSKEYIQWVKNGAPYK